jgi:hypothetical protein
MNDPRLEELRALTREGFERLCVEFPDQLAQAGTLFLGKHYARKPRGILMLGMNPGASTWHELDLKRQPYNFLLEGPADIRVRYWNNARKLFGASDELRNEMEEATFSFSCPFRTLRWNGIPRPLTQSLIRNSKPVLAKVLADCDPRLVILAGSAGIDLFGYVSSPRLTWGAEIAAGGDTKGTYRWRALQATFDGRAFVVAQIPHLSRAGSRKRLEECAQWLGEIVRRGSRDLDPSPSDEGRAAT